MKVCIIQTGRAGDTIITLPICKYYYDKGNVVDYIIHENYINIFNYIEYVDKLIIVPKTIDIMNSIPIAYSLINELDYDKIIDLSVCFPGSKLNSHDFLKFGSFVDVKYNLADVDIKERWNLKYNRNFENENKLYNMLVKNDYVLIHNNSSSRNSIFDVDTKYEKIYVEKIENFEIFDWYKIALNAKEIHCVDSSFANFIEVINEFKEIPKYIWNYSAKWSETILKNNWIIK